MPPPVPVVPLQPSCNECSSSFSANSSCQFACDGMLRDDRENSGFNTEWVSNGETVGASITLTLPRPAYVLFFQIVLPAPKWRRMLAFSLTLYPFTDDDTGITTPGTTVKYNISTQDLSISQPAVCDLSPEDSLRRTPFTFYLPYNPIATRTGVLASKVGARLCTARAGSGVAVFLRWP